MTSLSSSDSSRDERSSSVRPSLEVIDSANVFDVLKDLCRKGNISFFTFAWEVCAYKEIFSDSALLDLMSELRYAILVSTNGNLELPECVPSFVTLLEPIDMISDAYDQSL